MVHESDVTFLRSKDMDYVNFFIYQLTKSLTEDQTAYTEVQTAYTRETLQRIEDLKTQIYELSTKIEDIESENNVVELLMQHYGLEPSGKTGLSEERQRT